MGSPAAAWRFAIRMAKHLWSAPVTPADSLVVLCAAGLRRSPTRVQRRLGLPVPTDSPAAESRWQIRISGLGSRFSLVDAMAIFQGPDSCRPKPLTLLAPAIKLALDLFLPPGHALESLLLHSPAAS